MHMGNERPEKFQFVCVKGDAETFLQKSFRTFKKLEKGICRFMPSLHADEGGEKGRGTTVRWWKGCTSAREPNAKAFCPLSQPYG